MTEDSSIIYFVRHGECMGNISRKNLHPDEAVLTENGKLQAKLLGKHLEDVKFTLAYASDYPRALETAQIVLAESNVSGNLELQTDIRLREKYLGIFENGADISTMLRSLIASEKDFLDFAPEGAETREDIERRIEDFLQGLLTRIDSSPSPQTCLVVSHGAVLLHLWQYLLSGTTKFVLNNWKPEYYKITRNTGYYIVEIPKPRDPSAPREVNLVSALCSEHLKSLDQDTLDKFTKESSVANPFVGCMQQ